MEMRKISGIHGEEDEQPARRRAGFGVSLRWSRAEW